MNTLRVILKNSVVKNMSWIIVGRIVNMVLNFMVSLLSARYLGPSNYGLINYGAAYVTFFTAICNLGIDSLIVKELVKNKEKNGEIIGTSIFLKLVSCLISFIMILSIVFFIDYGEKLTIIVVATCSIGLFFQVLEIFKFWFQSKLQSKYPTIATTIAYVIVSSYKIILLITGQSVVWFAVSTSIEYVVVAILLYSIYKKHNGPKLSISLKYGKKLLSQSYHFIVSSMMVAVYNSVDKLMLKQLLSETEVGIYSMAVTIANLSSFILAAVIESFSPVILENYEKDNEKFNDLNRLLYFIVFYISAFFSIIIAIIGNSVVNVLYGEAYLEAIVPLQFLTWYTAFSYLGVARNNWIVCEGKQKYLKYIYIGSALFNVIFNYFLIPIYGATGAAFASLITQASTILIFPLCVKGMKANVKLMVEAICIKKVLKSNIVKQKLAKKKMEEN